MIIEGFTDEIHRHFAAENGLGEAGAAEQVSIIDRRRNSLLQPTQRWPEQFSDWLESLEDRGQELLDDILLISSRNRRLLRKVSQGILSTDEAGLEAKCIRSRLLDLLNETRSLDSH